MQFGPRSIDDALGAILAHSVRAGEARLRKGRVLSSDDIARLKAAGADEVIVARLEAGDVAEDEAAARIAKACAGADVDCATLLVDVGGRAPRPTLLASAAAHRLEERLVAPVGELGRSGDRPVGWLLPGQADRAAFEHEPAGDSPAR